ncbi:solute carrier family 40 protein member 1-like [Lytechinus pictus]|uniref:solute carrier family 40 protein member 1-like n=1 Tax=Lytechinus pictus TaxID=7653 RepID=UPI0030BA1B76
MASKGYEKFSDDEEEEVEVSGNTPAESPSSPAVLQEVHQVDPSAASDQRDPQPDLDLNLNVVTGMDEEAGGSGGGEGGGNGDLSTESRSSRWTYAAFYRWVTSNAVMLYISQFLSAWGDRMWSFTVALYLVEIQEQSLRLTAIYGLCISASSLIFGAAVGKWVDRTPRLRAARTSLIIQNSCVLVNACLLCTVLLLQSDILKIWNGGLYIICQLIIIVLGTLASLASLAESICIQKDWVVVVAGGDKEVLAVMNANMRRIDLISNILAPIAVGAIMTSSMLVGGIFVASWNAVSMVIEYWNLWRVYRNVPELAFKGGVDCTDEAVPEQEVTSQYSEMGEPAIEERDQNSNPVGDIQVSRDNYELESRKVESTEAPGPVAPSTQASQATTPTSRITDDGERDFTEIPVTPTSAPPASSHPSSATTATKEGGCCGRVTRQLKYMFEGWKVYKSYVEFWAGLGLAFLYMTVLGFDSITLGYGYSQGMPEYAMGILQALGSITGIFGTMLYPVMRSRIGLERAGLYSLGIQISFLMLCVGSLWAPGSPFIYDYGNSTVDASQSSPPTLSVMTRQVGVMAPPPVGLSTTEAPDLSRVQCKYTGSDEQQTSLASAIILFTGIVMSRIGLWAFDLVTTQLIQENVVETERGVFNGVQRALECCFDMIHFTLVIVLPCPETFGYLVITSILFVSIGACNYMVYSYKRRGHLVHMEKIAPCLKNGHV